MHPLNPVTIHIHQDHCYFEPFQETDQEAHLPLYRSNWWGKVWAWLGLTVKFQVEGTNRVCYVDKKDLNAWINKYEGSTKTTGNYQERIAQIIASVREQQWQKQREDKLIEIVHQIRAEQLKEVKANTQVLVKTFIDKLKNLAAPKQVIRLQQEKDDTAMCLKEDKYIFYFGDEKIIARPDRMETSHYFKHFLSNKNRRVISLELELFAGMLTNVKKPTYSPKPQVQEIDGITYTIDSSIYEIQEIQINQEIFEILKLYLEGKSVPDSSIDTDLAIDASSYLEPDSASNDEKLLDGEEEIAHLLTIPILEGLYALHQIIDISGILEIAYRNIDFYSQEKMEWEEQQVSPQAFWNAFANKYQDKKLKEICEEKYRSANFIESFLKKPIVVDKINDPIAAISFDHPLNSTCLFETQINSDGTNSFILNFEYDSNYRDPDYYAKKLKLLANFINSNFKKANISKIVVNLDKIVQSLHMRATADSINYMSRLIDSINQNLKIEQIHCKEQLELVFQNGNKFKFLEATQHFKSTLLNLLNTYHYVSFQNFRTIIVNEKSFDYPSSIQSVQSEVCFNFKFTFLAESYFSSFKFKKAPIKEQTTLCNFPLFITNMRIQYQPGITYISHFDFSMFSSLTDFTLEAVGNKQPWKRMDLSQLPFKKLNIKNTIVNSLFIEDLKRAKNVFYFDLQDCEIETQCQAEIGSLLFKQKQAEKNFQHLNEAIQSSELACHSLSVEEECKIQAQEVFGGIQLNLEFRLKQADKDMIDSHYQMGQIPSPYYQKRFSFISDNLSPEQINEINIKSISINFTKLVSDMQKTSLSRESRCNYMGQLLDYVNHHLNIGNKQETIFVFEGFPAAVWEHLGYSHQNLLVALQETLKMHPIILNNCAIRNQIISKLFKFLGTDQHNLSISCHAKIAFTTSITLRLKPSISSEPELHILFDRDFFNLAYLNVIEKPVHLILEQTNGKPWTTSHLSQLSIQKLTIRNAILDENFVSQLENEEGKYSPFPHLKQLILKGCKIEPSVKVLIEDYFRQLGDKRIKNQPCCRVTIE